MKFKGVRGCGQWSSMATYIIKETKSGHTLLPNGNTL